MAEKRLLERVREALRVRHYSFATERVYVMWVRRYILFHGKRHPAEMGKREVEAFLTHLAVTRGVSPSTQNQALQAILFMYLQVLEQELPWLDNVVRAKPKHRVPVVLSVEEVSQVLARLAPSQSLSVGLLYGSGLRVMECLLLRMGDLDFDRRTIRVYAGKGGKDRVTIGGSSGRRPGTCTGNMCSRAAVGPKIRGQRGVGTAGMFTRTRCARQ